MKGQTGERWKQLCEQAAIEQDPDKLGINQGDYSIVGRERAAPQGAGR